MAQGQIDLLDLFGQVSKTMQKNQKDLNKADTYNHDHGDHMVEIFDVITQAMKDKKTADPATQLEYAAQLLRKQSRSGSGKLYAEGLKRASKNVTGKELNIATILNILQMVMGAGNANKGGIDVGDLLGGLLGQGAGGGQSGGGDLLGGLLGGLTGSGNGSSDNGLDLGDLLGAGMDLMNAGKSGTSGQSNKTGLEALAGTLLKGATMTETPHRAQSSELVTKTMLEALMGMAK